MQTTSRRVLALLLGLAALLGAACTHWPWGGRSRPEIEGRVLDSFGYALEGASVVVRGTTWDGEPVELSTTADIHGRFRVVGIHPGQASITASFEGFQTVTRQLDQRYLGRVWVDIALPFPDITNPGFLPCRLRGTVRTVDGRPRAAVVVATAAFDPDFSVGTEVGRGGLFELELRDGGQYLVRAHQEGYLVGVRAFRCAAGDSATLDFVLEKEAEPIS